MLIVCNGAFKSGSTWIFAIASYMVQHDPIPEEFQLGGKWRGSSVPQEQLPDFLDKVDYKNHNYVFKSHFDDVKVRDLFLSYDNVYVLNIRRNLRDVMVSAYYHYNREDNVNRTFAEFYWSKGRKLVAYINQYHRTWHNTDGKIYVSSYDALLTDMDNEVGRIASFLKQELTPAKLEKVKNSTSLSSLRKLWADEGKPEGKRFFRKGVSGDWINYFTPEIEADFNKFYQGSL